MLARVVPRMVNRVVPRTETEGLDYLPSPGPVGQRLDDNVSTQGWLTLVDPPARKFLVGEMEKFPRQQRLGRAEAIQEADAAQSSTRRRCPSSIAACLAWLAIAVGVPALAAESARTADYVVSSGERDWAAAVRAAQSGVDAARAEVATEPLRLVHALTRLGEAQLGQRDLGAAAASFRESLTLVEQRVGVANAELLGPLSGLGRTLASGGDHPAAVPVLERGLQIARRSYGLFAAEQDEVLRQLAVSLRAGGRGADADQYMLYTLYIAERNFGEGDPRVVPAICALGEWFIAESRFGSARVSFQTALNIIGKVSPNDLAMVVPLTALARTYMAQASEPPLGGQGQRLPPAFRPTIKDATGANVKTGIDPRRLNETGEAALEHALRILDATPTAPRELVIDTLLQTGDWFQIRQQPATSLSYYQRASRLHAVGALARGNEPFGFPLRVYYRAPSAATRNRRLPAERVDEQYVEVEFAVMPDGSVDGARLRSANTTQRLANETIAAVRSSRYRPRFENGEPVLTAGVTYREQFRVRKETRK